MRARTREHARRDTGAAAGVDRRSGRGARHAAVPAPLMGHMALVVQLVALVLFVFPQQHIDPLVARLVLDPHLTADLDLGRALDLLAAERHRDEQQHGHQLDPAGRFRHDGAFDVVGWVAGPASRRIRPPMLNARLARAREFRVPLQPNVPMSAV